MSLFTRNLAKYGLTVTLQSRVTGFLNGLPSETFTNVASVLGVISTVTGVSVFDKTNTERVATHKICIAFRDDITAENWVYYGSKRLKILTVENRCERDQMLILMCTERGDDSKVVNQA